MTKATSDSTYDPQIDGLPISDVMTSRKFPDPVTATIAQNDATGLSGAIDLGAARYVGIVMPAAWDAASMTFQASSTLVGTYADVYDETPAIVTIPAATIASTLAKVVTLNVSMWKLAPWRFIKVRSGTTAVPVTQTAARAITFVLKP